MRKDMAKIATDGYRFEDRWGSVPKRRQKHRKRDDDRPTKESMSRGRYGTKEPGEYLNPLYRWLYKQAGRKWDQVYSEIVETISGGYTNIEHIKGHILSRVYTNGVTFIDGRPHAIAKYISELIPIGEDDGYVDDHGYLRFPKRRPKTERQGSREIIMLDEKTAAAKVDGTWFIADLKRVRTEERTLPPTKYAPMGTTYQAELPFKDALFKKVFGEKKARPDQWSREYRYKNRDLYAPEIRTMSKKEIKNRISTEFR